MKYLGVAALLVSGVVNAANFTYLHDQFTGYTVKGAPIDRYDISDQLPNDVVDYIYAVLPESTEVPPSYISSDQGSNIEIRDDLDGYATVDVTFLNEGAGYRNTFGYYIYDTATPPTSVSQIDTHVIVLPNASKPSVGDLRKGDTVDLQVRLTAGQGLGFFVIPNGWGYSGSDANVDTSIPAIYSHRALNTNQSPQNVMFLDELNKFFVLGFEDVVVNGDKDYNDLLFSLNVTPFEAVKPGTTPLPTPDGPKGGTSHYPSLLGKATIMFEDLWPNIGDYDFNDVVFEYTMKRFLVGDENLTKLTADFSLTSYGASYHNGFALQLPNVAKSNVSKASLTLNNVPVSHQVVEAAANELVLVISPDLKQLLEDTCGVGASTDNCIANNNFNFKLEVEFTNPIAKSSVGLPPYDPFIFAIDGQPHGDYSSRDWEVHLKQFSGTSLFNSTYFGTKDDRTSALNSFVSQNNMPWAINIADQVAVPKERVDISLAYPEFVNWVVSGGFSSTQWYKVENATPGQVKERN